MPPHSPAQTIWEVTLLPSKLPWLHACPWECQSQAMCLHLDNTGTWAVSVSGSKLGAPCHFARLEHSVAPLTSTHWISVTNPSCHSHSCLQSMQMSTAGQKPPPGEAFVLRPWRRKAKCPVLPPQLWRHTVTVHKLFRIRVTQPMPPCEQLYAAAVLHWSFRNNQSQTTPHADEPPVTLRGKLVPIPVSG